MDDYPQHLTIEDTIDNLGRTFLGLTINCARCHDHKFDPITTQDYYALYGIFHSTRYPWPGIELEQEAARLRAAGAGREDSPTPRPRRRRTRRNSARLDKEVQRLKDALKKTRRREKRRASKTQIKEAEKAVAENIAAKPLPFELAYAVAEAPTIDDVAVQQKGDPAKPGAGRAAAVS